VVDLPLRTNVVDMDELSHQWGEHVKRSETATDHRLTSHFLSGEVPLRISIISS
jgi:hypothetical protein